MKDVAQRYLADEDGEDEDGGGADPVATSLIHGYRPIITLFKANSKPSKE